MPRLRRSASRPSSLHRRGAGPRLLLLGKSGAYVGSWSDDRRDYRIPGTGADVWIVSTPARAIDKARYAEIIFPAGDNVTRYFGAVDDAYVQAGKIQQFGPDPYGNRDPLLCAVQGPGGYMAYDSYQGGAVGTCPQFNVGEVLGVLAVPIKGANGTIVGSRITLSVNGVAGQASDTPILNARLMAACRAEGHVLLNCGQKPFAYLPANANQWG
ncbi:hypothetical protein [Sphingomonas rubra]|uniref:Uncharacterized protein n=1 Tax=Sphingomonas rubra TaxID=634430 RepID=A0A1I5RV90_9SPHN|nr:hypothetical protein [Sphingomonas rubra]SFP62337.1 hypothetical protein SAMN04488241_104146 [Sphingomonas rubra]